MSIKLLKKYSFYLFGVVVFSLSFWVSYQYFSIDNGGNKSTYNRSNRNEIALVYLGCSVCPASTNEKLPTAINKISSIIKDSANANGYSFTSIGLSIEKEVESGIDHLKNVASFDEISVGNSFENNAIQKYVWEKYNGSQSIATPQIIITKRRFDEITRNGVNHIHPDLTSEEIMFRRVGIEQILPLTKKESFYNKISF